MNPDDINLNDISHKFTYERISREIDECDDVEDLQQMCKFLVKLEMRTRENYSVMIQDLMPDYSVPNP